MRINHVRRAESTTALCGYETRRKPKTGRPVCAECVERLMVLASRSATTYVWRLDEPSSDKAVAS